jgi:hypothetical protein
MWYVTELQFFSSSENPYSKTELSFNLKALFGLVLGLFEKVLPWHPSITFHLTFTGQNPLIRRPLWEFMG